MSIDYAADGDPGAGFAGHGVEIRWEEPLQELLARSASPGEEWLWCIFCERFFQAKHLRIDYLGNRQGCAFCRCAGFHCAIYKWDTFREQDDPGWPRSVADLRHGLRLPPGS